jgi:hypothetical protein
MAKAKRSPISQRRRARVGARIRSCFRYHFLSSVYHAPHTRLHLPTSTSGQLLQYRDSRDSSLSHNCRPSLSEQGRFALCLLCHPFCALLQNLWKRAPKLGIAFELPGRPTSDLRGRDQKRSPVFRVAWFSTILRLLHTICSPRGQQQRISTRSPRVIQEQTLCHSARVSSEARSCFSPSHVSTACFFLAVPPAPGSL